MIVMLSMSYHKVKNAIKKEKMMWPFVCNAAKLFCCRWFYLTFTSVITVGKEIVICALNASWSLHCWTWNMLCSWLSSPSAALSWLWNEVRAGVVYPYSLLEHNETWPSTTSAAGPLILSVQATPPSTGLCLSIIQFLPSKCFLLQIELIMLYCMFLS
jgi:hypothetical protein